MALIQCPDCSRQVSDAAPTCPGCGRPLKQAVAAVGFGAPSAAAVRQAGAGPVLIEQTSKKLKLQQLIAGAIFVLGFVVAVPGNLILWGMGASKFNTFLIPILIGLTLMLVGGVWAGVVTFLVWWHHR